MFHDEGPDLTGVASPAAATSAPLSRESPWRVGDLVVGAVLLSLGFGVTVLLGAVLAARGTLDRTDPTTAFVFALVTLLLELWAGLVVVLLARRRGMSLRDLGFRAPTSWSFVPLALLGAYASLIAYSVLILLIERVTGADLSGFQQGNPIPEDLPRTALIWGTLGLAVIVVAPVCEELFFRGLVYRGLAGLVGVVPAIVLSGLAFSVVHANASVILPFALIGMSFAWVYRSSGSLWTSIGAHAIFNGVSFVLTLARVGS